MKRLFLLHTILLTVSLSGFAQTWLACDHGLDWPPKALFADTISNKLYVSGFGANTTGTLQANGVASWDGTKWDTLGHGALGAFGEFLIRYKDKLYLQQNDNIYTWDFNTHIWDSLPGGFVGGSLTAAVEFNNDLIIVGAFNKIGSVAAHNIIRFDGTNFYPVGFPTFTYSLRTVAIYQNEIYIGGTFNDTIYGAVAKWNGSQWLDLDGGFKLSGNPQITSLKVYNNRLYAGGAFYGTKDKYMPSIAAWDGIKWNNAGAGIYYNSNPWGVVYKLHVWNNKLLVCGNFDRAGDLDVYSLAFWNDTSWCKTKTTPQSLVWVSTIFQNTLYIGEHEVLDNDSVHLLGYWVGGNFVDSCGSPVGIRERYRNDLTLTLYPNPVNNILHIQDASGQLEDSNTTIEIINGLGQIVKVIPFTHEINVSDMIVGFYTIKIKTYKELMYISKFIKSE